MKKILSILSLVLLFGMSNGQVVLKKVDTCNKFVTTFVNSFATQSGNNCTTYSIINTSNFDNNTDGITRSTFSNKTITIRDGQNNTLLGTQTVPINQDIVVFNINTLWTVQIEVTQLLNISGGVPNQRTDIKTLPCLIDK